MLEAPSISKTSTALPPVISRQEVQSLQGTGEGPFSQFMALARIRAMVVLPVPRGPEKRMAWATRPARMALVRVRVTWACSTTSSKV